MNTVHVRIRIDEEEDLAAAEAVAAKEPTVELEATSGDPVQAIGGQVEPITAVVVGAGLTLVAKFVAEWWERGRGGLIIDQRPGAEDQVRRDRDVPYGYVLVFPPDGGTVRVETKDAPKDGLHRLLETFVGGTFASAVEVAKAAGQAVGEGNVQVVPA